MTTTYTATQSVEILVTDFATPGMPKVWVPGTVELVAVADEKRRLVDVTVRTTDGMPHVLRVGPRGGNKAIRAAA